MTPEQYIANLIKDRGQTLAFVSKKTGIPYGHLQTSLSSRREMRADEYLSLCAFLQIDPFDYAKTSDAQ